MKLNRKSVVLKDVCRTDCI